MSNNQKIMFAAVAAAALYFAYKWYSLKSATEADA
jgi:hypothetical protein